MKEILLGWLAAQGIALANDVSDTDIVQAVQRAALNGRDKITALENGKSAFETRITGLENEARTEKANAATAATALANEQSGRKADRKLTAGVIVDEAIRRGIKTVAQRDAEITALENSADFGGAAKTLLATAPARATTTNGLDRSGKQQAGHGEEATALQNEYQTAFAAELIATGQNPEKAHTNVMTLPKYSGLAAKLVPKH